MSIQVNNSKARGFLPFRFLMGLIVLVACWGCMASATQAQGDTNGDASGLPGVPGPVMGEIGLEDLPSTDLSGMSSKWWKALRKEHTRLLGSSDAKLKQRALQNIIYFAHTYPDVDFTRTVPKLYKIYRYDENEGHRIMALAALGNIGNRNVMERLREDVSYETSERIRRQTLYVLAHFYKNQGGQ